MRILWIMVLVVLTACAPPPPSPPAPAPVFRDTSAQIASQTDVTPARLAGEWFVRQEFRSPSLPRLPISAWEFTVGTNGDLLTKQIVCDRGNCTEGPHVALLLTGPGRWTAVDPPAGFPTQEIWVMWMEFDSRTAAIGTPSGEFGWIMDKSRTGGGDRITAAREIMDWFGYETGQLKVVEF